MERTFAKLTYLRKAGDRAAPQFTDHFFQDEKTTSFPQPVKGARAGSLSFAGLPNPGETRRNPAKPGGISGAPRPLTA